MSFKLHVGCSRKLGLPNYGSRGASCSVETEVDGTLLSDDLQHFREHAQRIFGACAQAVGDELARMPQIPAAVHELATAMNGRSQNGNERRATRSQLYTISSIANREGLDLTEMLQARFRLDEPSELSIGQASTLIDELKRFAQWKGEQHHLALS